MRRDIHHTSSPRKTAGRIWGVRSQRDWSEIIIAGSRVHSHVRLDHRPGGAVICDIDGNGARGTDRVCHCDEHSCLIRTERERTRESALLGWQGTNITGSLELERHFARGHDNLCGNSNLRRSLWPKNLVILESCCSEQYIWSVPLSNRGHWDLKRGEFICQDAVVWDNHTPTSAACCARSCPQDHACAAVVR